jgi:1-acyl-sn-glycerol-3-phosphate acyltransferase
MNSQVHRIVQRLLFALLVRPFLAVLLGFHAAHRERLPRSGPALIVANHNSHLDTLALMAMMRPALLWKVRPVAAADHFEHGFAGFVARHLLRTINIARNGRAGTAALTPVLDALDLGEIVILFPEGSRGAPEVMAPFKRGIGHIVRRRPDVPVVPVYLHGMGKAMPRASLLFVPFSCAAVCGEPASLHGLAEREVPRLLQEAVEALSCEVALCRWREDEAVPDSARPAGLAEGVDQEAGAGLQGVGGDAVAGAGAGMPLHRHLVFGQRGDGMLQAGIGHHGIGIAVGEQHGRTADDLGGQALLVDQHAGVSDDARHGLRPAQRDMHRHHRALAEADERKVAIVQAQPAEFGVEIGVDQAGGAFVALLEGCGPLVHEAVPLPPHGILVASVGRVGTGEAGMGQGAL